MKQLQEVVSMRMKKWLACLIAVMVLQTSTVAAANWADILEQTAVEWIVTKELIRQYHYQKFNY